MSFDAILKIGLWNGSVISPTRRLLYQEILDEAQRQNLCGATAWTQIEGSRAKRIFRTVENEVASNELPMWMEMVDESEAIERALPAFTELVDSFGIVLVQHVSVYGKGGAKRVVGTTEATEIRIFSLERTKVSGKPIYQAVAELLRKRDILWISTTRAVVGFGRGGTLNKGKWFGRQEVPIVMTVVDDKDKVEACLPELLQLVGEEAIVTQASVRRCHPL